MKAGHKTLIIIGSVVLVLVLVLFFSVSGAYNGMVEKQEAVTTKASDVKIYLQRRADLIPNFVNTVKGYSDYEQETLLGVTEARAAVNKAQTPSEIVDAGQQLDRAVDIWVNAITEAYPDLKASQQYIALQDELAGSENRIATARKDYNDAVKDYNTTIKRFPKNIIAGIFGFEAYDYFEADPDASNVPEVSFE